MIRKRPMEEKKELSPEELLKIKIDLLFSDYIEHEPSEDLRTISEYFELLAECINVEAGDCTIAPDFLRHFEAVSLLLRDRLRLYPPTIPKQVEVILDKNVERVFAILSTFSRREVRRMLRLSFIEAFTRGFSFGTSRGDERLTRTNLFDAKIALNRLSQILRYASSIQLLDYDIDVEQLSDHYDPRLLDKPKLLALINLLKVQVGSVADASVGND